MRKIKQEWVEGLIHHLKAVENIQIFEETFDVHDKLKICALIQYCN
jgi:hypothetical protein